MTRRTVTGIVASVLLVALVAVAAVLPVPYVTFSPGPTVDVLAEFDGEEIVMVSGEQTYRGDGELRLTTVSVTGPTQEITLVQALSAWWDGTRAIYPRDAVYPDGSTADQVRRESSVQMVSSQDTAVAVALQELGFDLPRVVEVFDVADGGPASGALEVGDQVVRVNGTRITDTASVSEAVQQVGVGEVATIEVRRNGNTRVREITTAPSPEDPDTAIVGIVIGPGYDFPFDVGVRIDENIGGPSAGLIFSLAVYDTLTPGSLTGGRPVAGTGTLTEDGEVGAIGGIPQKIVAAQAEGAELFLVPPGNCAEALGAPGVGKDIELLRAETMSETVEALAAWADDPDADLPRCEG
ncbi:MAG: PDZ domain-containing protein [Nocardioides sp.]|nr:PDZ domain-containing protein [Nocardioides sp.]